MPVLSIRIPTRDIPKFQMETVQCGVSHDVELIDTDGAMSYIDIVGPLGKTTAAAIRVPSVEILAVVDKVRMGKR